MKIGIYGGTFDPVHNAHVEIAKHAIEELGLDKLLIMPTGTPAHKNFSDITDKKHRRKMCELAFTGKKMEISSYELEKRGRCFTFETVEHFYNKNDQLFVIVGGDSLRDIPTWKYPERIFASATVVSCGRVSGDVDTQSEFVKKVIFLKYQPQEFSSTELRVDNQFGISISKKVPKAVAKYIQSEKLYEDYRKYTKKVEKVVTEKRYEHIKNATVMGQILAGGAGVSKEDAFIALSLHDVAKNMKDFSKYKMQLKAENMLLPEPVVHAFVGAYVVCDEFKIKNKDIINAIKYHTTARSNMSQLEKLTYVSDCIEIGRKYEGAEELRVLARKDFEAGFRKCLSNAYRGIVDKIICPLTLDAMEYYKNPLTGKEN
ncbi:MAG: nicotinate (nicotinamide) nucleotide adenylyltransferase [Bacillota bacterium]